LNKKRHVQFKVAFTFTFNFVNVRVVFLVLLSLFLFLANSFGVEKVLRNLSQLWRPPAGRPFPNQTFEITSSDRIRIIKNHSILHSVV
jgi:hypothetical protein